MLLIHGDCLDKMTEIPSGSIDMVLADPPYGTIACKWDTIIPLEPMWAQLKRVVKPGGAIVIMANQPFTTLLISSNMEMFKFCWVWRKTKPSGYQIAKVKPLVSHEDIVVFGAGRVAYNPQMVLRNHPRTGMVHSTNNQMKVSQGGIYRENKTYTHRYPTTVIDIANGSQKGKTHPCQKPAELMEYLIRTYTDEGETVLDFAMGSGTTGVACRNINRDFVGIELDAAYFKSAQARIRAVDGSS